MVGKKKYIKVNFVCGIPTGIEKRLNCDPIQNWNMNEALRYQSTPINHLQQIYAKPFLLFQNKI